MEVFEIPVQARSERFAVALGGASLTFRLAWRNAGGAGWVLDIEDADGVPLVSGLPLIAGVDLLAQHRHVGIPGQLVVGTDDDDARMAALGPDGDGPTYEGLGTLSRLYWVAPGSGLSLARPETSVRP